MAGYSTPAWSNDTAPAINAAAMLALGQGLELAQHPYGVCSTAAATVVKTVSIDFSGTLALFAGMRITVKFTYGNVMSNPTLNVNGTGAKPILYFGSTAATAWQAGAVISLIYDGTSWIFCGFDSGIRVKASSYVGDGTEGTANPITLSFEFSPKLVIVYRAGTNNTGLSPYASNSLNTSHAWYNSFMWVTGQSEALVNGAVASSAVTFTQSGNTLSWYGGSVQSQLNETGIPYNYIALGW